MVAPTNNNQVLRDYRLALYQEHLGTVDLEFADERNGSDETDRIDVLGFERDFTESCAPGSDLGYVLLTNGMSNRRMNVPTDIENIFPSPPGYPAPADSRTMVGSSTTKVEPS